MDSTKLLNSSQRWLAAGLASFVHDSGPNDFAVHHVGVAMEHLLKAYLASLHPALVAETSDWESLLHATGHGNRSQILSSQTKTIGLKAAFTRVKKLLPQQITVTEKQFDPLLTARNGVAHAANYDDRDTRSVLTTCVRVATAILNELKRRPEEYWGDYLHLRDQLVDQHVTELRLGYTAKITRARETYRRRYNWLPPWEVPALVELFGPRPSQSEGSVRRQVGSCPACNNAGWLHGEVLVDWHTDEHGELMPVATLHAAGYDCDVCGLSLEGDELELAGFDIRIDMSEDDYSWTSFHEPPSRNP